ncbi:hypothetical protein B0J11DRAFT_467904 [Dendryphion nanum]|uniref:Zn(2)-C6 fungal-type domain-containing protein n=1 Tax=Dendryphion nanum TaxID=256645 RepID=A0A9P9DE95_9PLEO|nr:hypothetical protein B0J11DRAFT_467904 [Dendryphion nanum]
MIPSPDDPVYATALGERSRKRRAINACINCRTSKVRCDGKRPCQRCTRNNTDCTFHVAAKDENTLRIEKLEARVTALSDELLHIGRDNTTESERRYTPIISTQPGPSSFAKRNNSMLSAVDTGLITWDQATFWFRREAQDPISWQTKHYLVPIFSETNDVLASVASRSTFLLDAIVSIGCRAEQGFNSITFRQLQSRLREHLTDLLINTSLPSLEDVQAITLMAAYSENGFVLIALALRFAMQLDLPNAVDSLLAKTPLRVTTISSEEKELYRLGRVWHGICNLELFFSLDGGHLPNIAPRTSSRKIRSLINHPECTPIDVRLLSQVELNTIRSDAYNSIAKYNSQTAADNESFLRSRINDTTLELSLWIEEWMNIVSRGSTPHQQSLALLNLHIQHEWALITLHLKAVSAAGIENIAIMTEFQRDMVLKSKEAAERHLHHLLEASTSPSSPLQSPSHPAPTYLNTFRWTMDYVWAKGAFSVLLVLKLAILLRDPVQSVMSLLRDAHRVLEELKNVTIGYIPYFQILQTSIEKCEAALSEYIIEQTQSTESDDAALGIGLISSQAREAEQDFQGYAPREFIFEWDFPGLNLKHMPLGWQDLFIDIDGLF